MTPEESSRHPVPPEQLDGYRRFQEKAKTRHPQNWYEYPQVKHTIYLDNGGLGPAVRVTVPYRLVVWDVDEQQVRRKDDLASHEGQFEVLHVPPGQQKYADYHVDTTFYPAYRLELMAPRIVDLQGNDAPDAFTDAGEKFRSVEVDNTANWEQLRISVWDQALPASSAIALAGSVTRGHGGTVVVPVVTTATSRAGAPISWNTVVWLMNAAALPPWIGPFTVLTGSTVGLSLGNLPGGDYTLVVSAGETNSRLPFTVPP